MFARLKNTLAILKQENLDGLIVSLPANITYLTYYPSRDSYLLVSKKGNFYFTDSRYADEAKAYLKGKAVIKKINGSIFKITADTCLELGLKRVGFEERHLAFAEAKKIEEGLKNRAKLIPTHSLVEQLRQLKEFVEIEKIKKATQITLEALEFAKGIIVPGKREIEIEGELERFLRYHGAAGPAFDIIVARGENSAYPHHIPDQSKIKHNEPVLVDIGADFQGYKSDLTRVFFLGKISALVREVYAVVQEAQRRAITLIKPGQRSSVVDAASRGYIAKKGYGNNFGHNLGHGLGLEVHENPRLTSKNNEILEAGMVFTVEPGIYLPGKFGIRIEDVALVTRKGCEVLSDPIN